MEDIVKKAETNDDDEIVELTSYVPNSVKKKVKTKCKNNHIKISAYIKSLVLADLKISEC